MGGLAHTAASFLAIILWPLPQALGLTHHAGQPHA